MVRVNSVLDIILDSLSRSSKRVRASIWSDFSISQAFRNLDPVWDKLARPVAFILFSHEKHGNQFFSLTVIAGNPSFLSQQED